MTPQPPEMKTFVIWDYELEELTYGNRLDTKKQLNKDSLIRFFIRHKLKKQICI